MKSKYHIGQVVYSTRWLCYGMLTKRIGQTLKEGQVWEMTHPQRQPPSKITVVEKELRPLNKREKGR